MTVGKLLNKRLMKPVYRNANYVAFYVNEPFNESNLRAYLQKDFCYYQMLKAWKASDSEFKFIDAHSKTYNVRDDSNWERTLKPRLHERLRLSVNLILFLSSNTTNSRALREEINYAINILNLPIIVIYPEYSDLSDIHDNNGFTYNVKNLWNKLPIFRDNKHKVPVLHTPMSKELIKMALIDRDFRINTKGDRGDYYYPMR